MMDREWIAEMAALDQDIARAREAGDLEALAAAWVTARECAAALAVYERDLSVAVADLLSDVDYDPKTGYQLDDGTVIHHRQTASEKWRGRALLRHLSTPMIDPDTGEQLEAIPLRVLVDIIAGVADDNATSSRWRTTGLRNLDVDPDMFRTREWQPARTYLGVKR